VPSARRLARVVGLGFDPVRETQRIVPAATENRTVDSVPFSIGGLLFPTGVTQDQALSLAPVFAAARIIAGTVSTLPLKAYRKLGDDRAPMGSLPQLFDQLTFTGQLVPWLHRCVVSLVLRGNAYGLVTARDGLQFPTRIDWLNPADVAVDPVRSSPAVPAWLWKGRPIPAGDLIHIPWFTVPGQATGLSPIAAFASTINTGLYAQAYGSDWFEGGGFPPGSFQNLEQPVVDQRAADEIKARLVSAIRSRQPVVYGKDWQYTPITVPPNEAQFIQTMQLSATQIANIYGLPPEDVGGQRGNSLTYTTVELNQLERVLAIREWLVVLEHAFAAILPAAQYVKFNADAIVRADLKSRWEVYAMALTNGVMNRDEIRALEDMPPLPNGEGQKYEPVASPSAQPAAAEQLPPANSTQQQVKKIRSVPA
jgi:HK97 family phage portal protein